MFLKLSNNLANVRNVSCPGTQYRTSGVTPTVPFVRQWSPSTWHGYHQGCYPNYKIKRLPTRKQHLEILRNVIYDVVVIGGGAIGCGCALDAASRGLKTALLDASDFSSGASSKSSKLIHGGLNNLQAALTKFNIVELNMFYHSLKERATILRIAPHLVKEIPMLLPVYNYSDLTLHWLLLKMYDLLGGMPNVKSSHYLSAKQTHLACPLLSVDKKLKGSLVSYELQMDDARLCLALALTAARHGASIANYIHVQDLTTVDSSGIRTVCAVDLLARRACYVKTKCVINAAGPFVDCVRRLDSQNITPIAQPTAGTHIVLPGYFAKSHVLHGLHQDDIFVMPWKGYTIVGRINGPLGLEPTPMEVQLLLDKFRHRLQPDVCLTKKHVLSAWKGLWPSVLVAGNSKSHRSVLLLSDQKLLTITGGDWTNYRAMAEDAIDKAIEIANLSAIRDCHTTKLPLEGSQRWKKQLPFDLANSFNIPYDVAHHLASAYGCNAFTLLSTFDGCHCRLHNYLPYIEAEIPYAILFEYAQTAVDILARRMRIAFLDVGATLQMLPRVIDLMAKRLNWNKEMQEAELRRSVKFLREEMGMGTVTICEAMAAVPTAKVKGAKRK